jgi:hypothetical protein
MNVEKLPSNLSKAISAMTAKSNGLLSRKKDAENV